MIRKGLLLVVSGPSGAGKGTICKAFTDSNPEINISISATTRQPRKGEIDGVNYFFLTQNQFEYRIKTNEFYEYANNYGHYYGTPKQFVEDKLEQGEDVILEIDIKGALQVKKQCPDAVYIFVLPPSMSELKSRIIKRGSETEESLKRRFSSAFEEIDCIEKYDYYIINKNVEEAVKTMESIILAEKHRVIKDMAEVLEEIKEI